MVSIRRKAAAIVATAGLLMPTVLAAQTTANLYWSSRNDGWSAIRLSEGCYVIFYKERLVAAWDGYTSPALAVQGTGECGPDGLAEGPVSLQFIWPTPASFRQYGAGDYNLLIQVDGIAHRGVFQGRGEETTADDEDDPDGFHYRDLGDVRNPMPQFYRDGCSYFVDDNGQIGDPDDENCSAAGIQPMIDQLHLAGLIGGGAGDGSQSAMQQQQQQTPAAQTAEQMGDVFGKCVSLRAEEKRGIQDYWSLNNRCNQKVIVRYCFKANTEAAGNEGLCSQDEYHTHEIAAFGTLDFTFSLTDEGTPMSNGEIAGPNALSVMGFACTGGAFPQIAFEDHRMKFSGCS